MIRSLIPTIGIATLLLMGASDSDAWGCGWMGSASHHSDHMGWCWSTDEDHISNCGTTMGDCGMLHLAQWDLTEEDQLRIQEIMTEARAEIEEILSDYDAEDSSTTTTHGCRCCH